MRARRTRPKGQARRAKIGYLVYNLNPCFSQSKSYIMHMQSCVKHSTFRFFADDTRILKHIHSSLDVDLLQQDLNSVIKWAGENNMTLHEDKFEYIVHRHSPNSLILQLPFISALFVSSCRQLRSVSVSELKDL